ncbi:30S ribosomal protein S1 [Clostridium polyendosporum]|uniref:30S ribosomal protein S1 n=1 Tax=Clostridium polyendosporum TaxID=69208 RepID=A0A919VM37_9CLOT|nr:30S ribosomal protein S1 [Clostridium polyendosporum]GIM29193.1 30S ribosomal protein S1 [Clostridium polyendosporum]
MEKEQFEDISMDKVMKNYDFNKIYTGEIIKGKVIKVTDEEVFVNINYFADGIISKSELSEDSDIKPSDIISVDDIIDVMVLSADDGEGNVLLSKKQADAVKVWEDLYNAEKNSELISVIIKEEVKGGVVGYYNGIRVFMPASQTSLLYRDNLNAMVGQKFDVKIIELDKNKNKIVVSKRAVEKEEREKAKEVLWKSLRKGEKRKGKVVRIVKFGAFVDIGGVEGLIHISDLSWKRVSEPSEIVSVGDDVEVFVQDFDEKKGRISLALKDVSKNPWDDIHIKYNNNTIVEGRVTKFMNFGAFVEIEPGVEGLVHLAEISQENIAKPSDVLSIEQMVRVKILDIDEKNHKISLSIKDAVETSKEYLKYNDEDNGTNLADLFGDIFKDLK